jgi:hypothetical protein
MSGCSGNFVLVLEQNVQVLIGVFMNASVTEIWMSVTRVAGLLSKSEKTVQRMIASGRFESTKVELPTKRGKTRKTFIKVTSELREAMLRTRKNLEIHEAPFLKAEEIDGDVPLTRYFLADTEVTDEN